MKYTGASQSDGSSWASQEMATTDTGVKGAQCDWLSPVQEPTKEWASFTSED